MVVVVGPDVSGVGWVAGVDSVVVSPDAAVVSLPLGVEVSDDAETVY